MLLSKYTRQAQEQVCDKGTIHTHTHTVEYHSARRKKEILPFAMTQTNLEDIRFSEHSNITKYVRHNQNRAEREIYGTKCFW